MKKAPLPPLRTGAISRAAHIKILKIDNSRRRKMGGVTFERLTTKSSKKINL